MESIFSEFSGQAEFYLGHMPLIPVIPLIASAPLLNKNQTSYGKKEAVMATIAGELLYVGYTFINNFGGF
jgi:hypothetical protein